MKTKIKGKAGNFRVLVAASSGRGESTHTKSPARTIASSISLARSLTASSLIRECQVSRIQAATKISVSLGSALAVSSLWKTAH